MPRATVIDYQTRSDALHWAAMNRTENERAGDVVDIDSLLANAGRLEEQAAVDEGSLLERILRASGLSEGEAARRYVATLNGQQLARRTEPLVVP